MVGFNPWIIKPSSAMPVLTRLFSSASTGLVCVCVGLLLFCYIFRLYPTPSSASHHPVTTMESIQECLLRIYLSRYINNPPNKVFYLWLFYTYPRLDIRNRHLAPTHPSRMLVFSTWVGSNGWSPRSVSLTLLTSARGGSYHGSPHGYSPQNL